MNSLIAQVNDIGIESALVGILAETSSADVDAVIQQNQVAPDPVEGSITANTRLVMVPKAYTSPRPVPFTVSINAPFSRTGILSPSNNVDAIQIRKADGTVMQFNGTDNEFSGLQLQNGVRLFAIGRRASRTMDDFTLTLDLAAGPTPVGPPTTISFTAVELLLDICVPRSGASGDPPALPQPVGSGIPGATDKWFGGRLLNEQDSQLSQERAVLIVRQPKPPTFNGRLQIRGVAVSGTTIGNLSDRAQLFEAETPISVIELPLGNPHEFNGPLPANGRRFFVQGNTVSNAARDMGFQLGFAGGEPDGDRVAVTVGVAPMITTASNVVVVKKSGLNPARKAVTLRTSSTFNGSGTLSRSGNIAPIKLFRANGTELTFGPDPVFSDVELDAGVQLFAEGVAASGGVDDYILTLTLTPASTVLAGHPVEKRMTAVELTLDVALSRTAPGVDPPIMPQPPATPPAAGTGTDKINLGRFVQVRDPGFTHERAMLIVRPPNPSGFSGTLVLAPINAQVEAFRVETPASGQTAITPIPFPIPRPIPAGGMQLFVQGVSASNAVRDTGFNLGIVDVEPICDRVLMTTVQVEVADTANPAVAASTFVRFGLWDNAFRAPGSAAGLLFNEEAEADNFVGADTKRFHLRVRDITQRTATHVQADWTTLDQSNNDLDAPLIRDVTLVATPANSGVFISRGLMLINDTIDQNQATHTGLAAPLPDAGLRQPNGRRNHRTRKASMLGSMRVAYRPSPGVLLSTRLPVFQRSPEERLRLPLQIFVLRVAIGGDPVIGTASTDPIWSTDLRIIRETYERIGIKVETVVGTVGPTDTVVTNGGDSILVIDPPAGVNSANVTFANETAIGTAHPPLTDTIRVFFVRGLASGNGGETWSDALVPAGDSRRAASFTIQSTGPYAAAHEMGHSLTAKRVPTSACDPAQGARGHFCAPTAPAGNRFQNDQNHMKLQFLGAEIVTGPKRIWDTDDADAVNQFTRMRGSRLKRNF